MNDRSLAQVQASMEQLQQAYKTLLLSTVSAQGVPEISYAPFAHGESGCFYIFVSELASHTANLLQCPKASVLFIEDEHACRNLYARERLSWQCDVVELLPGSPGYEAGLQALEAAQGEMVAMLRSLSDFHLFALQPTRGHYVVGFGRAYVVDPSTGLVQHIDEQAVAAARR